MAKKRRKKAKSSKKRRKTSKKRARKTTAKRRKTSKKTRRSGKVPSAVIVMRAKALKKNARAAAIYRDVLGC
jgi:hypothetical protein